MVYDIMFLLRKLRRESAQSAPTLVVLQEVSLFEGLVHGRATMQHYIMMHISVL